MSLKENMYNLSLGIPDFPTDSLMTRAHFMVQISWPEGRPKSRWGSACPAPELEPEQEEDMMTGDSDEEEGPDPRWTQPSYETQDS